MEDSVLSTHHSSPSTERYIIVLKLAKPLNVDGCEVAEQSTNVVCQMLKETSMHALKPDVLLRSGPHAVRTYSGGRNNYPISCHVRHSTTSSAHEIQRPAPSIGHPITFGT